LKLNVHKCWCDVFDKAGNWCGCITLAREWIAPRQGKAFNFIAVSDAKSLTVEECLFWNYYVPKEREESE
jgi:hypothetical protein